MASRAENNGSAGVGGLPHLSVELLKGMTGINILHVPYKGAGPALAELLGGQTQVMCTSLAGQLRHIKAGRVRALAVTTTKRNPQVPDVQHIPTGKLRALAIVAPTGPGEYGAFTCAKFQQIQKIGKAANIRLDQAWMPRTPF